MQSNGAGYETALSFADSTGALDLACLQPCQWKRRTGLHSASAFGQLCACAKSGLPSCFTFSRLIWQTRLSRCCVLQFPCCRKCSNQIFPIAMLAIVMKIATWESPSGSDYRKRTFSLLGYGLQLKTHFAWKGCDFRCRYRSPILLKKFPFLVFHRRCVAMCHCRWRHSGREIQILIFVFLSVVCRYFYWIHLKLAHRMLWNSQTPLKWWRLSRILHDTFNNARIGFRCRIISFFFYFSQVWELWHT